MYQRVLVPLDGSELAEQALEPALRALDQDGTLVLCRILLSEPREGWEPLDFESMREKEEKEAAAYLQAVADRLTGPGIDIEIAVRPGPVADAILQVAAEEEVGVIVLCSHGRSGFSRWFLGSVAERVLRLSWLPVLVYKNRPEQQD